MKRSWKIRLICLSLVLLAVVSLSGCGGLQLGSVWRSREVAIDGLPTEWEGTTTWIENPNVTIGLMNDDEYLYMCFATPVRGITAQIVREGLTVWLDPAGKKEKKFGIHYPTGSAASTGGWHRTEGSSQGPGELAATSDRFKDMIEQGIKASAGSLDILGPEEGAMTTLKSTDAAGVEAMLGYDGSRLVYELKVPLRSDEKHPYAIGYKGKGDISIGFEIPEMSTQWQGRGRRGGGGPGGGEGGGGEGVGGEGGGGERGGQGGWGGGEGDRSQGRAGGMGHGGGRPGASERVEVWGKVHLAATR